MATDAENFGPPIASPDGEMQPVTSASPSRIGFLLLALGLGMFCLGLGVIEAVLQWDSLRRGPFPVPSLAETILFLTPGFVLTYSSVVGFVQRKQRRGQNVSIPRGEALR